MAKIKNKKKMTLDKLGVMVERGFNDVVVRVAKGFEHEHEYVEKRFDELEKKLDVRKQVEEHEKKINRLGELFDVKF